MQSTVKSLKVTYDDVSEKNTFTNGDRVAGQVLLEVAKECKVESLYVTFKGKAEVLWTERHGQTTVTYHSKDKYFSIKHYFIRDGNATDEGQSLLTNQNGKTYSNLLAPGSHVFPFSFQFPLQEMPSSFTGSVGKIVYLLETKTPQHDAKDTKMHMFNPGTVAMDVKIEKSGFFQGERLKVSASVQNNSTREIKPKYCIYRKHSFFARGKRRLDTKDLFKEVGEPIPPSASVSVQRVLTIPRDVEPSILNCQILKAEYRLRVYLDIKYASDPKIKFPITILAAATATSLPSASGGVEFGSFGCQNPPAWDGFPPTPPPPPPFNSPPPYEAYEMYPSLMDFGGKQ